MCEILQLQRSLSFFVNFSAKLQTLSQQTRWYGRHCLKNSWEKWKKNKLNHLAVKKTSLSNGRLFTEVNHRVEASFDWLWCIIFLWTWSLSPSVVLRFNGVGGYFLKFQPILFNALGWPMTAILYSRYSATCRGFDWANGKSQLNFILFLGISQSDCTARLLKLPFQLQSFADFFPEQVRNYFWWLSNSPERECGHLQRTNGTFIKWSIF